MAIINYFNATGSKPLLDQVDPRQVKPKADKNYLARKCETLDKQIDELVYQLYGLTEEEIKSVKGM